MSQIKSSDANVYCFMFQLSRSYCCVVKCNHEGRPCTMDGQVNAPVIDYNIFEWKSSKSSALLGRMKIFYSHSILECSLRYRMYNSEEGKPLVIQMRICFLSTDGGAPENLFKSLSGITPTFSRQEIYITSSPSKFRLPWPIDRVLVRLYMKP